MRYRYGFFARTLRQFMRAKMRSEGWRQYDVAQWLGVPPYALSEYLNRHTHPTTKRRRQLEALGCSGSDLLRAEQVDKLDWWMRSQGLSAAEVRACLRQLEAHERGRSAGRPLVGVR